MGQREYSRHRGCALRAVQKAIEAGRIKPVVVDGKPRIDSDQADRDWLLNTDPAKQSLLYRDGPVHTGAQPPAADLAPPASEPAEPPDEIDESNAAFREHRAEQMSIRVAKEKIELDQLRGNLIALDEAKRLAFTAFRSLRDALLNVPSRIKDQLAGETDPFKVEQLLEAEISGALGGFNRDKVLQDAEDDEAD